MNYKEVGVNTENITNILSRYKHVINEGGLNTIRGFCAIREIPAYKNPAIVTSSDGVGTKTRLAIKHGRISVISQDLVAMCYNDIITSGALPLQFQDYISFSDMPNKTLISLLDGIVDCCKATETVLSGGEIAQMPGTYAYGYFDIAGFAVGIVDKDSVIDGSHSKSGDIVLGIASSGLHSNGYSIINRLLDENPSIIPHRSILTPTYIYTKVIRQLIFECDVVGIAHITGGGLIENISRIIPDGLSVSIGVPKLSDIHEWVQKHTKLSDEDMLSTFNCGYGMCVVIPEDYYKRAAQVIHSLGYDHSVIGRLKPQADKVTAKIL